MYLAAGLLPCARGAYRYNSDFTLSAFKGDRGSMSKAGLGQRIMTRLPGNLFRVVLIARARTIEFFVIDGLGIALRGCAGTRANTGSNIREGHDQTRAVRRQSYGGIVTP
jgi:hypothetical protein